LELLAAERAIGSVSIGQLDRYAELLEATDAAISHEQWDAANAAFHEHQIDLAGNALLSRFYRELSVNLMMQVIRGGHVEGHEHLVTEHRRIVEAISAGDLPAAERAIREHIETGRRIALDAIDRAGGTI
ncbi:MAG TPA: FCD domain-containing protein, partial [Gaiellaceae bacterium]|nr:FCD domain-containing protein [Gaiellaceae bacterium]